MFNNTSRRFYENKIKELENEVCKLKTDLQWKNEVIMNVSKQYKSSSVAIDFDAMKVFAIERAYDRNRQDVVSVIGYYRPDNTVGQYTIECDQEIHEALVDEFYKCRNKNV